MDLTTIDGPWSIGADEDAAGVCSVYAINSGFREVGPGSPYRYCALLRMPFEETDTDGKPTSATTQALSELDDRLRSGVQRTGESVLVGRYTTNGVGRTFCFYTKDFDSLTSAIGPFVPPYQGRFDDARTGDDPTWGVYNDLLRHAMAGEPDIHLVKRLDEMGVDIRGIRIVEHVLYFPSVVSAREAVTNAFSQVDTSGPDEVEGGNWRVVVRLQHSLQFADIAHWRNVLVRDVCSALGGSYDGWGIPLEGGEGRDAG